MGIRYDRDSKRATNGPLIFFSDPASKEAIAEEIRGAIYSGLSFYCYRAPNSHMISFGSSEICLEAFGIPGFVIGFFNPEIPVITIPYKNINQKLSGSPFYEMPESSTTFNEYKKTVGNYIESLKNRQSGKIVAARVILKTDQLDPAEKFFDFCERFPESYIFCFSTPLTGGWIGASPELLLEGRKGELSTVALAGTRKITCENTWDKKNLEEQRIVTDYILEKFEMNGLLPIEGETFDKQTGQIEHICTPIKAINKNLDVKDLENLIKDLSPTPALCGNPKDFALKEIFENEKFQRGCYGGFCGPYQSHDDFNLNVVLRCASFDERKYCIYVGGGITSRSVVEKEWEETEIKAENTFG